MSKLLMVIANNGFQDTEFGVPYQAFQKNSIDVDIAAGSSGECIGVFGKKVQAKFSISEIDSDDYDMIVFIGGGGTYSQYFGDEEYLELAKQAKKLGAICIAPMIISQSGVFNGKNATGWDQGGVQREFIQKNGGVFVDKSVVVCGNIVTANGPEASEEFARRCVELVKS